MVAIEAVARAIRASLLHSESWRSGGDAQCAWNRLAQAVISALGEDPITLTYKYDALGRRIQRGTSFGALTKFVYDGADVIRDLNANGSVAAEDLNGPGVDNKIRQTKSASGALYFTQDHLGSTRALTNASGNIVEQQTYDSFGNGGSSLTRYTYTGREFDAEINLYYNRARWYDPQVGRFISEDPIGFDGGANWYAYVDNDPVDFNDPSGLRPLPRSFTGTRECDPEEMAKCCKICGAKGVQSCRISQTFRMMRIKAGKALWRWVDGPLSCSCNDCDEKKERVPVPVPNPRRLNMPTMEEFRLQEESGRQMERFWTKVLIGDAAVGAVLLAPESVTVGAVRLVGGAWRWVRWVPATAPALAHH